MKEYEMVEQVCKWYGASFVAREVNLGRSSLARYRNGTVKKVDNKVIDRVKELFADMANTEKMYCKRRVIVNKLGRPRKKVEV